MEEKSLDKKSFQANIALYLILTLLTCGVFNLYWNYKQMEACNTLIGKKEFSWALWFFASIVTCGLYHLYYQYKMGSVIVDIQNKYSLKIFESLPVVSIVATLLGFSIVTDMIHQHELNKICEG